MGAGIEQRLIRIALHGLRGPITVKGKPYQLEMPPMGVFEDEQIATVLTYVRREWGHAATPVASATRDQSAGGHRQARRTVDGSRIAEGSLISGQLLNVEM